MGRGDIINYGIAKPSKQSKLIPTVNYGKNIGKITFKKLLEKVGDPLRFCYKES